MTHRVSAHQGIAGGSSTPAAIIASATRMPCSMTVLDGAPGSISLPPTVRTDASLTNKPSTPRT
eukprot:scaffold66842_cov26-Tisochrysis_lutea.AAC.1